MKIIHIDDDKQYFVLMKMSLGAHGIEVMQLTDARLAQTFIDDEKNELPELFLVDLMMPGMDGIEFITWLRRERKIMTPCILMTAVKPATLEDRISDDLLLTVVQKPFKSKDLVALIKEKTGKND
jgi:DNA-binding response OmpR family regulator